MNIDKLVAHLFEIIAAAACRPLSEEVLAIPPGDFFSELPSEQDQAALTRAAQIIGGYLTVAKGPIPAGQLAKAIDLFHDQSQTGWCPPLIAALEAV